ncbi:Transcriptional effector CCR4-related protein [Phaffia rhodozyma]|uniref:Transcriptional effector CCR4-related protein n=1 Tax=Phaffia rhodozyma TaxID=264483 RepID=A0A0F7SXL0_PHARH|nr:Transcriptional effector CCR4-related protein [Phaffia rhodozyma]
MSAIPNAATANGGPKAKPTPAPKVPYQLTPEQIARQEARKKLKARKAAEKKDEPLRSKEQIEKGKFLLRTWVDLQQGSQDRQPDDAVRVMSWNILAQTLIRRDLFPGSDCLKWTDREQMLISELDAYAADIICLQEVDRLESLIPHIPTHKVTKAKGHRKRHGLVILHRDALFEKLAEKTIYLDELEPRDSATEAEAEGKPPAWKRGGTRETKNIGLLACLKRKNGKGGVIVCTTHTFWHPMYLYERTRQLGLLLRETARFRKAGGWEDWPCIMAGDFNTQPFEPSYTLLRNPTSPLSPTQIADIQNSSVIHSSVINVRSPIQLDNSSSGTPEFVSPNSKPSDLSDDEEGDREGEAETEQGGSRDAGLMKGCRRATEQDGLLSIDELRALFAQSGIEPGCLLSLYDSCSGIERADGKDPLEGRSLESRRSETEQNEKKEILGSGEPNYTSYTPLWHLTLDYIFLLPPATRPDSPPKVIRYLLPHQVSDLEPGLPRKGISASDHVIVAGDILLHE